MAPAAPGTAVVGPGEAASAPGAAPPGAPLLEPDVQVVRFQGPPGLTGRGARTGAEPGARRRRRRDHHGRPQARRRIPAQGAAAFRNGPGRELYPVIEIVGHLHRPEGIDPGKYPIRVVFNQDDLDDTVDRSRLVTKVIYLEDPDQAIPFRMPKDQVPVLTLSPTEPPLRVAQALGRPVAIVRMGVRKPTIEEIQAGPGGRRRPRLGRQHRVRAMPVPDLGAARGAACPAGRSVHAGAQAQKPTLPARRIPLRRRRPRHPGGAGATGRVGGIDPRDTVVGFDIGIKGRVEPRVLPTNIVCIYAPRFAEVRVSTGAESEPSISSTPIPTNI